MNLAERCIKNNRTTAVALVLIAAAGIQAFFTMSRLESPSFVIRFAVVTAYLPGASPQKVEELVTDPIEKKVQEMAEVKSVVSESLTGMSVVQVELQPQYFDLNPIWTRLRNKMKDLEADLPQGTMGPFVDDEFGDEFPVVLALTGDGYTYREMKDYADTIRDELLRVEDVAKVNLYGTQEERVFIEFSQARLAELGMTTYQLADALQQQNILQPGGRMVAGPEQIILEATGEFQSVDQIRRFSLRAPGRAEAVYLEDVAEIRRGFVDPPTTMARFNGHTSIMLAVNMAKGGKVTDMGEAVRRRAEELQARLPVGLDLNLFLYQPKYVDRSIRSLTSNLAQAFAFVFAVMLVMTGLRTGLLSGLLVPLAMLMSIAQMPLVGIDLQSVSIASLVIALGMLVDNGIVTSENILVRLGQGEERLAACGGAVKELWLPLLTSSLTTICAFLPIATAQSDVGEYCRSLFWVVTLTLLNSWVLSLTFIPFLGHYLLRPKRKKAQTYDGRFYVAYRGLLLAALRHRGPFVAAVMGLFAAGLWGFRYVPTIFFPPNEREMMLIDFWQPYGTDIRTTRDRAARLEEFLLADPEVVSVGAFVGEGGPRWYLSLNIEQANANYANLVVNTVTPGGVKGLVRRTRQFLNDQFPDGRFTVKELENGPPVGSPIQIRLAGPDLDTLYRLRDRLVAELRAVRGTLNVRDDWGEWTKKAVVEVNQDRAKRAGFTSQDVAHSLQTQVSGLTVTEYREGREVIPVELRSDAAVREDLGRLESLEIYAAGSAQGAPLGQLARIRMTWQPSDIRRRETVRTMTVSCDVEAGLYASGVLADLRPRLEALRAADDWPADYRMEIAGEDQDSQEAMQSISVGLPLAAGLLALILIAQFNSFRRMLIILLTVPPMMAGVTPGLLLTRAPFGFMAFLGLISLMGIIVNNAIMMIDRIEIERAAGQALPDAIVLAAQRRLRPILATATTTVVGLLPLSLGGGEMWRPMANTIMFGLGFATILTLMLCPVLYACFFGAKFRSYAWDPSVLTRSKDE